MSEELEQFYAPHSALMEELQAGWARFATPIAAVHTDYFVVGKQPRSLEKPSPTPDGDGLSALGSKH